MQDIFSTHEELRQILINPMLEVCGKKKILEQIFSSELHPLIMNFLYVMVDRRRSAYIWKQLAHILRNLVKAEVF